MMSSILRSTTRYFPKLIYIYFGKGLLYLSRTLKAFAIYWQEMPRLLGPNGRWKIIPLSDLKECSRIYHQEGELEKLYFPKIHNLTEGGELTVRTKGFSIYRLTDVSFVMDSDFIRGKGGVASCDKLFAKEYEFARPGDRDLVALNGCACKLKRYTRTRTFQTVFHITGTFFRQWAHFLAQFYPKLDLISKLPNFGFLTILIPTDVDPHIKFMIKNAISSYDNIELEEVSFEEEFYCTTLYYPQIDTHISDIGLVGSAFHLQISDATVKFWHTSTRNICPKNSEQYRKIYIGRNNYRGISNGDEVFQRFQSMGFEECFPHKLNMKDKIKLFSEAKYIVGPLSSGFANSIFSQRDTKLLLFSNCTRHDDMYFTKFAAFNNFDMRIFTGRQLYSDDANSDFTIDIVELDQFISESDFFQ